MSLRQQTSRTSPRLSLSTVTLSLSVFDSSLDEAPFEAAAHSQHSDHPLDQPLGVDPAFDALFEASVAVAYGRLSIVYLQCQLLLRYVRPSVKLRISTCRLLPVSAVAELLPSPLLHLLSPVAAVAGLFSTSFTLCCYLYLRPSSII